jgi:hypothetical protein
MLFFKNAVIIAVIIQRISLNALFKLTFTCAVYSIKIYYYSAKAL